TPPPPDPLEVAPPKKGAAEVRELSPGPSGASTCLDTEDKPTTPTCIYSDHRLSITVQPGARPKAQQTIDQLGFDRSFTVSSTSSALRGRFAARSSPPVREAFDDMRRYGALRKALPSDRIFPVRMSTVPADDSKGRRGRGAW
ncbi:hypothetical protein FOZ62_027604, partial [Perkinsus olseni]